MTPPKHHQLLSSNPNNSIKSRFTQVFLKSLSKINRKTPLLLPYCPKEIFEKCTKVKIAADKSLAFAVGSRKAWSRALLFKIRSRQRRRRSPRWRCRTNSVTKVKEKSGAHVNVDAGFDLVKRLRKLVPGGESMELSKLLEEAADYIKCLSTQVQVMRCIADSCSSSSSSSATA